VQEMWFIFRPFAALQGSGSLQILRAASWLQKPAFTRLVGQPIRSSRSSSPSLADSAAKGAEFKSLKPNRRSLLYSTRTLRVQLCRNPDPRTATVLVDTAAIIRVFIEVFPAIIHLLFRRNASGSEWARAGLPTNGGTATLSATFHHTSPPACMEVRVNRFQGRTWRPGPASAIEIVDAGPGMGRPSRPVTYYKSRKSDASRSETVAVRICPVRLQYRPRSIRRNGPAAGSS